MAKIAAAVLLAVVLLITGSASAVTLEVTSGSVLVGNTGFTLDPTISLEGEDFSLDSGGADQFAPGAPGGQAPVSLATLIVAGQTFSWLDDFPLFPGDSGIRGSLQLFHAPAALPTSLLVEPFETTFTMTGHVDLGGGFDLIGHGILVAGPADWDPSFVQWTYTFTTPEPSSLALLLGGVGALGIARRWKKTRTP